MTITRLPHGPDPVKLMRFISKQANRIECGPLLTNSRQRYRIKRSAAYLGIELDPHDICCRRHGHILSWTLREAEGARYDRIHDIQSADP